MRLGGKVVDLGRLNRRDDADEVGRVGQVCDREQGSDESMARLMSMRAMHNSPP